MHVLGGHVDGKINKNGLQGQYYASHLGTCCQTPPTPLLSVCVTEEERNEQFITCGRNISETACVFKGKRELKVQG